MAKGKKDNSAFEIKAGIRQRLSRQNPDAMVLEFFAGEGRMWSSAWSSHRGVTLDKDPNKIEVAAAVRGDRWATYLANSEKAIADGLCSHEEFAIVDIDAYGSPWPFLHALLRSERRWPAEQSIVMTDGFMSRSAIVGKCIALFGDNKKRTINPKVYLEVATDRMHEWAEAAGLKVAGLKTWRGAMSHHLLVLRR